MVSCGFEYGQLGFTLPLRSHVKKSSELATVGKKGSGSCHLSL